MDAFAIWFAMLWHFCILFVCCWVYWITRVDQHESQDMLGHIILSRIFSNTYTASNTIIRVSANIGGTILRTILAHLFLTCVLSAIVILAIYQMIIPEQMSELAQTIYGGLVQSILGRVLNPYVLWPARIILEIVVVVFNLVIEFVSQLVFGIILTIARCSYEHLWDICKTIPDMGAGVASAYMDWSTTDNRGNVLTKPFNTTLFTIPMKVAALEAEKSLTCACENTGFIVKSAVAVIQSNHTQQSIFYGVNTIVAISQAIVGIVPPYNYIPDARKVAKYAAGFSFHSGGVVDEFIIGVFSSVSMGIVYTHDTITQQQHGNAPDTFQRVYKDFNLDAITDLAPKEFIFATGGRLGAASIEGIGIAINVVCRLFKAILDWELTSNDLFNLLDASAVWRNLYISAFNFGHILSWLINAMIHVVSYGMDSKPYTNFMTQQMYQCNYSYSLEITNTLHEECKCTNQTCGNGLCINNTCSCMSGWLREHPTDMLSPCTIRSCSVINEATNTLLNEWKNGTVKNTLVYLNAFGNKFDRVHVPCMQVYSGMLYDNCVYQSWEIFRNERVERPGTRNVQSAEEFAMLYPEFMLAAAVSNSITFTGIYERVRHAVAINIDIKLFEWYRTTNVYKDVGNYPDVDKLAKSEFSNTELTRLHEKLNGFVPSNPKFRTFSRSMLPPGILEHRQIQKYIEIPMQNKYIPTNTTYIKSFPTSTLGFCGQQCRSRSGSLELCHRYECKQDTSRCVCSVDDETRLNVTTGQCQHVQHTLGPNTYKQRCTHQRDMIQDMVDSIPCTVAALSRLGVSIPHVIYEVLRNILFRTIYADILHEYSQNIFRTLQSYDGMWYPRDKTVSCEMRKTFPDLGTNNDKCSCDLHIGEYSSEPNMWCDKPTLQASVYNEMEMIGFYLGATTPLFGGMHLDMGKIIQVPFISQFLSLTSNALRPGIGIQSWNANVSVSIGSIGTSTVRLMTEGSRVGVRLVLGLIDIFDTMDKQVSWFDLPINCKYGMPYYSSTPPTKDLNDIHIMKENIRQQANVYEIITAERYDTMGLLEWSSHTPFSKYVQTWFLQDRVERDVQFVLCGYTPYDMTKYGFAPKCRLSSNYNKEIFTKYRPWTHLIDPQFYATSGAWCNSLIMEWLFYHMHAFANAFEKIVAINGQWDKIQCISERATYLITNKTAGTWFDETTFADLAPKTVDTLAELEVMRRLGTSKSTVLHINSASTDYASELHKIQLELNEHIKSTGLATDVTKTDVKHAYDTVHPDHFAQKGDVNIQVAVDVVYKQIIKSKMTPTRKAFQTCNIWGKHDISCALGYTGSETIHAIIDMTRSLSLATMEILRLKPSMDHIIIFPHVCNYERILGAVSSIVSSVLFSPKRSNNPDNDIDGGLNGPDSMSSFAALRQASAQVFFTTLDILSPMPFFDKPIKKAYPEMGKLQNIGSLFVMASSVIRDHATEANINESGNGIHDSARRIVDAALQKYISQYGAGVLPDIMNNPDVDERTKSAINNRVQLATARKNKHIQTYTTATTNYEHTGLEHYTEPNYMILQHWPVVKKLSRLPHKYVIVPGGKLVMKKMHETTEKISMAIAKSKQAAAEEELGMKMHNKNLLETQLAGETNELKRAELHESIRKANVEIEIAASNKNMRDSVVAAKEASSNAKTLTATADKHMKEYSKATKKLAAMEEKRTQQGLKAGETTPELEKLRAEVEEKKETYEKSKNVADLETHRADVAELQRRANVDEVQKQKAVFDAENVFSTLHSEKDMEKNINKITKAHEELEKSLHVQRQMDTLQKDMGKITSAEEASTMLESGKHKLPISNHENTRLEKAASETLEKDAKKVRTFSKLRSSAKEGASKMAGTATHAVKAGVKKTVKKMKDAFLSDGFKRNAFEITAVLRSLGSILSALVPEISADNMFARLADLIELVFMAWREYYAAWAQLMMDLGMNIVMAIFKGDATYLEKALEGIMRGISTIANIVLHNIFLFIDGILKMLGVLGDAISYVVGPVCLIVKGILEAASYIIDIDTDALKCPKIGGRRLLDAEYAPHIEDVLNVSWNGMSYCDMFMQTAVRHGLTMEQLDKSPSDAAGTIDCLRRRVIGENVHNVLYDIGIKTFPVSFFYDPWTACGWTFNISRGVFMWTTHSIPALMGRHHIMFDKMDEDVTHLNIDITTTRQVVYATTRLLHGAWNVIGEASSQAFHEFFHEWDPEYTLPTSNTLSARVYQLHKSSKHIADIIAESNINLPQTLADTTVGVQILGTVAVRSIGDRIRTLPLSLVPAKSTKPILQNNEHIADYAPLQLPKLSLMTQSTCTGNQRQHGVCIGCAILDNFVWDMYTYANHTHTFFLDNCTGTKASLNERLYNVVQWFDNGTIRDPYAECSVWWNHRELDNFPTSSVVRVVHDTSAASTIREFLTVTNDTYIPWVGHSLYYWTENILSKCDVSAVFCQKRRDLPYGLQYGILVFIIAAKLLGYMSIPRSGVLSFLLGWLTTLVLAYDMSPTCFPRIPTCLTADIHHILTSWKPCLCMYLPWISKCTQECNVWWEPEPFITNCTSNMGMLWNIPFYFRWQYPSTMAQLANSTIQPIQTIVRIPAFAKMVQDSEQIPNHVHPQDIDCWYWTLPSLIMTCSFLLLMIPLITLVVISILRILVALLQTFYECSRFIQHSTNVEGKIKKETENNTQLVNYR